MELQQKILGVLVLLWNLLEAMLGFIPGYMWMGVFLFIGISYQLISCANHLTDRLDRLESKIDDGKRKRGSTWLD